MTSGTPSDRERWAQIAAICDAALSLEESARAEYVRRACGGDSALRREVNALLSRAGDERGFLSAPAALIGGSSPMPELSGQRIGDFDIGARLGAGGMGVVYRAHDRTLGRDVALKVLPDDVSADAERIARLRREAKLLAALSHPHIGAIYGFVEANGTCALVLELIEGDTLAAALSRRPMSLDSVMTAARQILDALDHAHRRGVIHRDLKPSNLMLTPAGLKLVDFGIGKLTLPSGASRPPGFTTDPVDRRILGTPNYMAPEQLEDGRADARSDLFAFGAVFHEMLSGRPVFSGDSQASIVASVLTTTPGPLTSSTGDPISPELDRIIGKCLEKDPELRWQSARDLRDALGWLHAQPAAVAPTPRTSRALTATFAIAVIGIIAAAGWASFAPRSSVGGEVSRFSMAAPRDAGMDRGNFDVSPDGRHFVYRTWEPDQLLSRRLAQFETNVLGAEAGLPTFSPDGKSIAFLSKGVLYRKRFDPDGAAVPIAEIPGPNFDFEWTVLDTIIFSGRDKPIRSLPAAGGQVTELTQVNAPAEVDHHTAQILPGGRAVLFAVHKPRNRFDVAAQILATGERKTLIEDAYSPQYSPSGHLLFGRGSTIFAVPFDAARLQITGAPVTVVQNVGGVVTDGDLAYRLSTSGTLVYQPAIAAAPRTLVWMDRNGHETPLPLEPAKYEAPRISPDGLSIAYGTSEPRRIWRYDITTRRLAPLTPADSRSWGPIWTADGKALMYTRDGADRSEIVIDRLDGNAPTVIGWSVNDLWATGVTADGALIVYEDPPTNNYRVSRLTPGPDARPLSFVDGAARAFMSQPSPDGSWVAFSAIDPTGQYQLFIQPSSGNGVRRQVTVNSGLEPVWSRDGRELFFRLTNEILVMPIEPGKTLSWGPPKVLFSFPRVAAVRHNFDVAPDGRFLVVKASPDRPPWPQLNVVVNWAAELPPRAQRSHD